MCGLAGAIGTLSLPAERAFKDMLYFHSIRGQDSTGVCFIPRDNSLEPHLLKAVGASYQFLEWRQAEKAFSKSFKGFLGHCRSATRGSVTARNAHPFRFEHTIGMHNGTIDYQSEARLDDAKTFQTDSEAIIYNIDKNGPEETIKKLEGSYTIIWYDLATKKISMIRNEKRPLSMVLSDDGKALFFGSEMDLVVAAMRRNNFKIDNKRVIDLDENTLLTWTIPDENQVFSDPEEKEVKGYERPLVTYGGNTGGNGFNRVGQSVSPFMRGQHRPNIHQSTTTQYQKSTVQSKNIQTSTTQLKTFLPSAVKPILMNGEFEGWIPFVDQERYKILRNPKTFNWMTATKGADGQWQKLEHRFPPHTLSYTPLDINARHEFKHVGKKKKKTIFYVGWQGQLLNEASFEALMVIGCNVCGRSPEWGNKVYFVNQHHEFLCEYCALNPTMMNAYKAA